jgi:tRNA threonylcarbamoyladenosine biosynthesis protein TsaB
MTILGIDSAIPEASVALVENGSVLAEERHTVLPYAARQGSGKTPSNHAEIILPLIETLFAKTHASVQQLSGIAVSIGPGSFTGLRIGLATAKGLAYESGVPLVGISTLHANAARVGHVDAVIGSMLDARKSEVYLALFRSTGGKLLRITDDAVMPIDCAVGLLKSQPDRLILTGDGAKVHERRLVDSLGTVGRIVAGAGGHSSVAAAVARLGAAQLSSVRRDEVTSVGPDGGGALAPTYLRLAEAELKRKNFF